MYFYRWFCVHKIFYVIIRKVVFSIKVHLMMPNKFHFIMYVTIVSRQLSLSLAEPHSTVTAL